MRRMRAGKSRGGARAPPLPAGSAFLRLQGISPAITFLLSYCVGFLLDARALRLGHFRRRAVHGGEFRDGSPTLSNRPGRRSASVSPALAWAGGPSEGRPGTRPRSCPRRSPGQWRTIGRSRRRRTPPPGAAGACRGWTLPYRLSSPFSKRTSTSCDLTPGMSHWSTTSSADS